MYECPHMVRLIRMMTQGLMNESNQNEIIEEC